MPKGKGKKGRKPALKKLAQAMQGEQQQEQRQRGASPIRSVMVVTGGTADKPVRENAASYPPVTGEEISRYGSDKKRVIVGLAMNLLAGVAPSREVLSKDGAVWAERSLRTDKLAFFKILESDLKQPQIVDAWQQTLKQRKRYDQPTLQALSKAVRQYKIMQGTIEARVSPMEKFARDCLAVLNDRTLTDAERIRNVRAKLTEKANYDAETPMPVAAAGGQ